MPDALLPTIRSRCQALALGLPAQADAVAWLAQQGVADPEVLLAACGGQPQEAVARGNYEKALPLLAKIISLDPGNPEAKDLLKKVDQKMLVSTDYVRGVESYSKEDYGSAVQYLKLVYDVDPQYRDVGFLYHDAESHYMPLESMSKELTDLYAQGVDYYMGGHYQKAVEVWEKVLEKNPKNFLVRRNLEEARSRLKDKPQDNLASPNQPDSKGHP